ncbi:MAG: DMT(drug/metabolite transporter) superfamily permease [Parachlamydiales bacterium]|nr:DMT(drug/metabolite transporter) superfamily permease [Parachlamydiales bacterium]
MSGVHKKNLFLGVLVMLFSFFCVTTTNTFVKLIDNRINPLQIILFQNIFGVILMTFICFSAKRGLAIFKTDHFWLLFLRAMAGLGAFFFVFISIPYLSVANATLMMNTAPFFVPFLLFIFFKKPIDHLLWFGIIPGFLGLILILRPSSALFQWISVVPLIAGLSVAVILITLRRLHHYGEDTLRILFYLFLFVALVTLPLGIYFWTAPTAKDYLFLLGTAIFGFLGQTTVTIAMRLASPQALAPLCYSSVVFALLFDWWIWHSIPSWLSLFGIALVILGGVLALFFEVKSLKKI